MMLKSYLRTVLLSLWPNGSGCTKTYLLGEEHDLTSQDGVAAFEDHFRTHLLFTYRHSFSSLFVREPAAKEEGWFKTLLSKHRLRKSVYSDGGWGCTIRVFQMGVAQALLALLLPGKRWSDRSLADLDALVCVINHFRDTEDALFGIHNITAVGEKKLKVPLTSWYGPTSCGQLMCSLLDGAEIHSQTFRCLHFDDGYIHVPSVRSVYEAAPEAPLVIMVSLRLGLECIDLGRYKSFLRSLFRMKQFGGLCGGNSLTSAYYFIACNDEYLFYLDPHIKVQPALESVKVVVEEEEKPVLVINDTEKLSVKECVGNLFPDRSRQLPWRLLNPSMTVILLCRNAADFSQIQECLEGAIYFDTSEHRKSPSAAALENDEEYLLI